MSEIAAVGRAKAARLKRMAKEWDGFDKPALSGWCIDKLHNKCPSKLNFGRCICQCHETESGAEPTPTPESKPKRGRPRGSTTKKK